MHWLIVASGIGASLWTNQMMKLEQAATKIKITALEIQTIAQDQVENGKLERLTELLNANAELDRHVESARLAMKALERSSQK